MKIFEVLVWFLLGLPLVEVVGYWVHRLIFHDGLFGRKLRQPHVQHHMKDYPIENLRPVRDEYKSAADPLWHVIGAVILVILLLLVLTGVFSLWAGLALAAGSILYAKYVVSIMHMQFHLPHSKLQRFAYFRRLVHFHDVHHYVRGNYGIVFLTMDRLFGTFQDTVPPHPQDIFPK